MHLLEEVDSGLQVETVGCRCYSGIQVHGARFALCSNNTIVVTEGGHPIPDEARGTAPTHELGPNHSRRGRDWAGRRILQGGLAGTVLG